MKVLIAGGGTGGHLFPGIAVAEEVLTRHPKNDVVFVGTERGLEAKVVPKAGFKLETIRVRGLKGVGLFRFLLGLVTLPWALVQSWTILRRHLPDVVVGVGGFSSGPVVLAAWLQRVPAVVQEQNALPGMTNRILGRLVPVVFIAFEEARRFFPARKVQLVGNPIRRSLLDNYLRSRVAEGKFTVLVFGGSLGAKGINQRLIEALDHLKDLAGELHFIHQTGRADVDMVRQAYAEKRFSAEVVDFIDDMSKAYARSDLVICRAGATTLSELTVCKKASILIPFPFATDGHQEVNASALVSAGAAVMFRESELTGEALAKEIRGLRGDPGRLEHMERQAGLLGRPEAAKELADVCAELMVRAWGHKGRARPNKETSP